MVDEQGVVESVRVVVVQLAAFFKGQLVVALVVAVVVEKAELVRTKMVPQFFGQGRLAAAGAARDELPYEERCKLNYDHPDSFDTPLMVAHLRELRAGHPVQVPVYDYTIHNRSDKTVTVQPAPVIIVEGILIFDSPELCDLMDMKVFVDTDADVRILRRIVRDVKERGRTLDSVVNQYLTTVKPMHEQFVEPSKRKADLIVPEGGHNLVALELLIKWVDNHLHAVEAE